MNNIIPLKLPNYINVCMPEGSRYTRRNAQIHDVTDTSTYESSIVPCNDAFRYSFFQRTMLRWNDLPVNIRQVECLTKFKTSLQNHLWTAADDWPD